MEPPLMGPLSLCLLSIHVGVGGRHHQKWGAHGYGVIRIVYVDIQVTKDGTRSQDGKGKGEPSSGGFSKWKKVTGRRQHDRSGELRLDPPGSRVLWGKETRSLKSNGGQEQTYPFQAWSPRGERAQAPLRKKQKTARFQVSGGKNGLRLPGAQRQQRTAPHNVGGTLGGSGAGSGRGLHRAV